MLLLLYNQKKKNICIERTNKNIRMFIRGIHTSLRNSPTVWVIVKIIIGVLEEIRYSGEKVFIRP